MHDMLDMFCCISVSVTKFTFQVVIFLLSPYQGAQGRREVALGMLKHGGGIQRRSTSAFGTFPFAAVERKQKFGTDSVDIFALLNTRRDDSYVPTGKIMYTFVIRSLFARVRSCIFLVGVVILAYGSKI